MWNSPGSTENLWMYAFLLMNLLDIFKEWNL